MRYLLTMDPGKRACGWAVWETERNTLVDCGITYAGRKVTATIGELMTTHLREFDKVVEMYPLETMVVERMFCRPRDRQSQPNDLLDVQLMGGALMARGEATEIRYLKPSDWKGSVPKRIHHKRLQTSLWVFEKAIVEPALEAVDQNHKKEILDSVGIGLYYLKRTNKSGAKRNG